MIQGNLEDASTELLGNHQIPTPVKFYTQGKFQEAQSLGFGVDTVVVDDDNHDNHDVVTVNAHVAKLCVAR